MGSHPCFPRPSVCGSLDLTLRSRRRKLIIDLSSPVERVRLPIFATLFPIDYAFCQTRSIVFALFLSFTLSSPRPNSRSQEHISHFSACLLVSRCASRGCLTSNEVRIGTLR